MKPTLKHLVAAVLPYTIILIAIYSILPYYSSRIPFLSYIDNTTIWWVISYFILIIFLLSNKYFLENENKKSFVLVTLFLLWMLISIVRGAFVADNYWDWKGLVYNSMGLLLPIVAYSATNKVIVQSILSFYVKYGLPLFFIIMFITAKTAFGFYLMPVSFLLIFLPALSNKHRFLLFSFAAIVFLVDLGARSNVIKFAIPLMLLFIYYFRNKLSNTVLESARLTLIIAPFVFLILGVNGVFNVFNMNEYLGEKEITKTDEEGKQIQENLVGDTRTFIYVEVIESAIRNDYWVFGRTPARGNDSPSFGPAEYDLTRRDERLANEIGVANVFTWSGIVGVILYMLIFYKASYLAINRSKNIYIKMIGVYVAFRWFYSWIEDINNFSLNFFMLWIMIGLCFSYSFRMMTDYEVTIWIRGVFDKRYLNFDKYFKREKGGK